MRAGRRRLRAAALAGILLLGPAAGAVPAATAVIDSRSQEEAKAALEAALPGAGGRLVVVSPHDYLQSILLPLRRAGVLKDIVAVLPFDNALSGDDLRGVVSFLDRAGVPQEDRKTFSLSDGCVAGTIEGMPVRLCTLTTIPPQDARRILALDTAFLPAIYRNDVKTPMVDLAWKVVLTLRKRGMTAGEVVLFDATGRPDFPLEAGYLATLLREMLSDPERFSASLPEKWRLLKAAETAYFFAQYDEGMALYREYLGKNPGDASACLRIALMAMRDLDVEMALQWINRAADASRVYRRAYAEVAEYVQRKELYEDAERILLAGLAKFPKDAGLATSLAATYLARGEDLRRRGDDEGAKELFGAAAGVEGAEPRMRERARALAGDAGPGSAR